MLSSSDDSGLWHVAFSTEDVRVWSLDQLNDAFRFDVVSAGTLVQKHGTPSWQRLGVMAGLEPEGTPNGSPSPNEQAVKRALRDAGLLVQSSVAPPAHASYAPPPSFAPAPLTYAPLSAPPIAAFTKAPKRQGSSAGWLLAATLLGAVPVLYRNDLLLTAAQRVGREPEYLSIERSFGGPGYGTPRQLAAAFPAAPTAPLTTSSPPLPAPASPSAPTSTAAASSPARPSSPAPSAATGAPTSQAVSLDAIPLESPAAARPAAGSAPAPRAAAGPVAKASTAVALDDKPAKAKPAPKVEEPIPTDPLKAAIFTAVKNDAKKKK